MTKTTKNWARCRKCEDVIESRHRHDFVTCQCGAISLDGGRDYFRVVAQDFHDVIRLDDQGNEVQDDHAQTGK